MDADVFLQFLGEQLLADEKLLNPRKTGGRFPTSYFVVTRTRHASESDKEATAVTTLLKERTKTIDMIEEGAENPTLKRDVVESVKFIIATPEVFQKIVKEDLPSLNIHGRLGR